MWSRYRDVDTAKRTVHSLHQRLVGGVCLAAKFELGIDKNGHRVVDRNSHHTVRRHVAFRKGSSSSTEPPTVQQMAGVSYTYKSIFCRNIEFPFPSGLYLTRVIQLTNILSLRPRGEQSHLHELLRVVTDYQNDVVVGKSKASGGFAKEVSEGMAMADATERALRMVCGECYSVYTCHRNEVTGQKQQQELQERCTDALRRECVLPVDTSFWTPPPLLYPSSGATTAALCHCTSVKVYVLGDGVTPLSAACIALHLCPYFTAPPVPSSTSEGGEKEHSSRCEWSFVSIDPLLRDIASLRPDFNGGDNCTESNAEVNRQREEGTFQFDLFKGLSQDYELKSDLKDGDLGNVLSVVVACHSHAPLQEFWDRMPCPKIAVTMACCADYCELDTSPMPALHVPPGASCSSNPFDEGGEDLEGTDTKECESTLESICCSGGGALRSSSSATELLCEFDDFEVYSPKRNVKIYYSGYSTAY